MNTSFKIIAFILSLATIVRGADIDAKALYVRVRPSVVLLMTFDENDQPIALATGFAIADGTRIATNCHVLAGASKVRLKTSDGTQAEIKSTIALDASRDLAVLVSPIKLPPIPLASTKPAVGDSVLAIGNPKGLEASISAGLISGIRELKSIPLYQISAAISPGSSGGPVLNSAGETIGISTFIFKDAQNINFCVPTPLLQPLLASKTESPITQLRNLKTADVASIAQKPRQKAPNQTEQGEGGLHENMTMLEVEQLLGKPDDIKTERGNITAHEERPIVIKWYYRQYEITDSGPDYGKPGYLNFIPERFTRFTADTSAADNIARSYGEGSDTFRTYSYQGSFPTNDHNWEGLGSLGFIPIKILKAKK